MNDLNQKIKQSSSTASNLRRQYRRQVEQLRRRISPRPIALSLDSKSKPVVSSSENIISDIQPKSVKYFVPKIESKVSVQSDYVNASSESVSTVIDSLFDYTN